MLDQDIKLKRDYVEKEILFQKCFFLSRKLFNLSLLSYMYMCVSVYMPFANKK